MRVWHSPWSWLKAIVPLDSVAGNTLIGMFTRLIFRKPFQVARAAITVSYRLNSGSPEGWDGAPRNLAPRTFAPRTSHVAPSHPLLSLIPLVVGPEVQTGAGEMNRVLADLVAQQPPRRAVFVARDCETPRKA